MNVWWIVLPVLACTWAVPMWGARHSGLPWWFFLAVGGLWSLVALAVDPLYDLGIRIRRRLGLTRLAEWGQRLKPQLLPPARLALLIMALISVVAGIL